MLSGGIVEGACRLLSLRLPSRNKLSRSGAGSAIYTSNTERLNNPRGQKWDNRTYWTDMPLGLYISVPFCRTKCSYCNFASGVFSRAIYSRYVERVC